MTESNLVSDQIEANRGLWLKIPFFCFRAAIKEEKRFSLVLSRSSTLTKKRRLLTPFFKLDKKCCRKKEKTHFHSIIHVLDASVIVWLNYRTTALNNLLPSGLKAQRLEKWKYIYKTLCFISRRMTSQSFKWLQHATAQCIDDSNDFYILQHWSKLTNPLYYSLLNLLWKVIIKSISLSLLRFKHRLELF